MVSMYNLMHVKATLDMMWNKKNLRRDNCSHRKRHLLSSRALFCLADGKLHLFGLLQNRVLGEEILRVHLSPVNKVVHGTLSQGRNKAITLLISLRTCSHTFLASYHFTVPAIRGLSVEIFSQLENTLRSVDMMCMIQGLYIRNNSADAKIACLDHAIVV